GAGEADSPATAKVFDGTDHLIAIQASRWECHDRDRVESDGLGIVAIDPQQLFWAACHARTAMLALLDDDQVKLALVITVAEVAAQATGHLQLDLGMLAVEGGQEVRGWACNEIIG